MTLTPGDVAPDWELPTADGSTLRLSSLRGRRVVLYAYPAAMTSGCTTQACDFRDSLASLTGAGYQVVGISPDPPDRLAEFAERDSLTFPLVSDTGSAVLKSYGAHFQRERNGRTLQGVVRSTFVIDEEGRIERALYNVIPTGHVAALRAELGVD
ncbi:peroxiredoxin [Plantactinospora sp. CA-290183]|uniref:peroxiredoxin n=1 Tax=Plantactinospora sp. CA-290183 TaxID=3240006 RepID=UPI003D94C696